MEAMMKLVSVAEMQAIERQADQGGLSYAQMMENAGAGLAQAALGLGARLREQSALGLVGSGNNGGDTLVALAALARQGWQTAAYCVRPRPPDDPLSQRLREAGGQIFSAEADTGWQRLTELIGAHALLLDGVLGTGIRLPLAEPVAGALAAAQLALAAQPQAPCVLAVDCPSGVDCDSGAAAPETLAADLTVTMAAVKQGLLRFPAFGLVGQLQVVDIGLTDEPAWLDVKRSVASAAMVRGWLPRRPPEAHKGTFGTLLVIAGSANYTGAALLAGKAAYRVGAGLVTLAIPAPLHAALAGHFPEATWLLLPHELGVVAAAAAEVVRKQLERPTALLIGPGFGTEDTTRDFLARLLGGGAQARRGAIGFATGREPEALAATHPLPPLVIDADGLKLLARLPDWPRLLPEPAVLTPHPGEMSVLTGLEVKEIQSDRLAIAERFATEWGQVVVLKGAHTVVAAPGGQTCLIPVATAALARAGTGDVLAGLIGGLRAQGLGAYPAAVCGCWIHAQAGLRAAQSLGNAASVLAGDVLAAVSEVVSQLTA
jgi:hydroxyethylthiazole kinase-like uncharacterized protein yjeF